jgi:hypothetical protein
VIECLEPISSAFSIFSTLPCHLFPVKIGGRFTRKRDSKTSNKNNSCASISNKKNCKATKNNKKAGTSIGQLDTTTNGRLKSLQFINNEIAMLVKQYFPQFSSPAQIQKFMLRLDEYDKVLAKFNLSAYETMHNKPNSRFLLKFHMINPNIPQDGSCDPFVIELDEEDRETAVLPHIKKILKNDVCLNLERSQTQRMIELTMSDILTTLPNMWFNSVAIDACINYFKELTDNPEDWYIVSAEDTPERADRLRELQQTKGCNRNALLPLYRDHHWTISCIDHELKVIYYLNSDVVDRETPVEQTRPFQQAFPGYKLIIIPCLKQCDNSSCGAYVCYWAYAFFFLSREALLNISCPDILRFRTLIRRQLLLSYYVCPAAGASAF